MEQVFPKKGISVLKQKERNSDDKMAEKKKHITELIGKIFKDQFAQQEKNMSNLFSGIFSLTKQQIEES